MTRRLLEGMALGLVLWSMAGAAAAVSSVSLTPVSTRVELGSKIILMLYADFRSEPALGGGLDVLFDHTALGFDQWLFMAPESVGDDPDFRRQPDVLPGELNGIAFGNSEGMHGRSLVGFITFDALAPGRHDFTIANNQGGPPNNPGPFVSFLTGLPMDVDFSGATVSVGAVPLPGAAWLLLGGLGALAARRRRRA